MATVRSFSINSNNDLYLDDNGNIAISIDITATTELVKQYMQTLSGELVLNTNLGIPYFQAVWSGVPNLQQFESASRTSILSVDGVSQLNSFTYKIVNKILNYVANITTVYGQTTVQGVMSQ